MTLSNAPSEILLTHLLAQNVFTDPAEMTDWPLFRNQLPDDPKVSNLAASIYDSIGVKDGRLMDGPPVFHHGLQIRLRSRNTKEAWTKTQEIEALFQAIKQLVINVDSSVYLVENVSQTGPPIFIGYEEFGRARRPLHTLNFLITVSQTS